MKTLPRLVALLLAGCAAALSTRADHHEEKLTFVIVHGATAGGYEWKETGRHLADQGHDVYRVTLTALGERSHLDAESVDLETHIMDVVNTIRFEGLHDVILTGHSYGGMVITGVMDRIPERLRHVIYFDAMVPADGQTAFQVVGNNSPEDIPTKNGRWIPGWLNENPTTYPHNSGHPVGTLRQPVSFDHPDALALNVTVVAFIPEDQSFDERMERDGSLRRAKERGWTIRTFPGSHVAMLEDPVGVAQLTREAANDTNSPPAE